MMTTTRMVPISIYSSLFGKPPPKMLLPFSQNLFWKTKGKNSRKAGDSNKAMRMRRIFLKAFSVSAVWHNDDEDGTSAKEMEITIANNLTNFKPTDARTDSL